MDRTAIHRCRRSRCSPGSSSVTSSWRCSSSVPGTANRSRCRRSPRADGRGSRQSGRLLQAKAGAADQSMDPLESRSGRTSSRTPMTAPNATAPVCSARSTSLRSGRPACRIPEAAALGVQGGDARRHRRNMTSAAQPLSDADIDTLAQYAATSSALRLDTAAGGCPIKVAEQPLHSRATPSIRRRRASRPHLHKRRRASAFC